MILLIVTVLSPYVYALHVGGGTGAVPAGVTVYRVPEVVKAYEPITLLIRGCSPGTVVRITTEVSVSSSEPIPGVALPVPKILEVSIPVIPLPALIDGDPVCIAVIPGLPALKEFIEVSGPLGRKSSIEVDIKTRVDLSIVVNGEEVFRDSFEVLPEPFEGDLRPTVFLVSYDVISKSLDELVGLLKGTGGTAPPGYSAPSDSPVRFLVMAMDRESKPEVIMRYSVSGGSWLKLSPSEYSDVMKVIKELLGINDYLKEVEDLIKPVYTAFKVPRMVENFFVGYVDIPPQEVGTYVTYYAVTMDSARHTVETPMFMYYVYNAGSDVEALIIDPHVELWLINENLDRLAKHVKSMIENGLPNELVSRFSSLKALSEELTKEELTSFHHWEYLSKYYRIYVIKPMDKVAKPLETLKPDVIILSNLWLGISSSVVANWDLRDVKVDSTPLLSEVLKYIKERHKGSIAAHGSLSDTVILICSEGKLSTYKIGSLGHVGNSTSDIDPLNEKVLSSALGLHPLPIWEVLKFEVARCLCRLSTEQPYLMYVSTAIGSAPLQVPYVPFDGKLVVTKEGEVLGWDIPREFTIEVPGPHRRLGLRAYTEVG